MEQSLETVYEVDEEAEVASSSFAEEQQTQSSVTGTYSRTSLVGTLLMSNTWLGSTRI